jgi:hypothetical protein
MLRRCSYTCGKKKESRVIKRLLIIFTTVSQFASLSTVFTLKSTIFWDKLSKKPAFTRESWLLAQLIFLAPKMEATFSFETSVDTRRTTRRYIPEDRTFHNHRCENLKSYMFSLWWLTHYTPVISWLGRYNLLISPSERILDSDITQRIL